jgi:WD40 repeat protein
MQQRKAIQEIETSSTRYVLSLGKDGDQVNDAIWLPDRHIVAVAHGRAVLLWDGIDGTNIQTFPMQKSQVYALACSPDCQHIALGINRAVVVRDTHTGKYLRTYSGDQHWGEVESLSWSPDGRSLAWTGNPFYAVQVWDTIEHHQVTLYYGHETRGPAALAWSPDSTKLVTGSCYGSPTSSYEIQIWEAQTGQVLSTFACHSKPIRALAWSPDGRWIVSGGMDGWLQVIDARISELTEMRYESQQVMALAWSPDGMRIAIGLLDGTVVVQNSDLRHTFLSYRCHYAAIKRVAWSPDGRQIVSVAYDNSAKIWDVWN